MWPSLVGRSQQVSLLKTQIEDCIRPDQFVKSCIAVKKTATSRALFTLCRFAPALLCVWRVASAAENKGQIAACSPPLSEAIPNSCVVSPGVLWRGSKPDPAGAASLLSLGVRTVVNLEWLHDDIKAFQVARPAKVLSKKLDYFRIREWEPNVVIAPSVVDSHLAEFLAIVKTQPKPIYVHCRSGQNRTGVMVAAYRVLFEGSSPESAIAEMGKYRGIWFKEDAKYINSLKGKRRANLEALINSRLKDVRPTASLTCSVKGCEEVK
jgi:Tyrosine phosphatase family